MQAGHSSPSPPVRARAAYATIHDSDIRTHVRRRESEEYKKLTTQDGSAEQEWAPSGGCRALDGRGALRGRCVWSRATARARTHLEETPHRTANAGKGAHRSTAVAISSSMTSAVAQAAATSSKHGATHHTCTHARTHARTHALRSPHTIPHLRSGRTQQHASPRAPRTATSRHKGERPPLARAHTHAPERSAPPPQATRSNAVLACESHDKLCSNVVHGRQVAPDGRVGLRRRT